MVRKQSPKEQRNGADLGFEDKMPRLPNTPASYSKQATNLNKVILNDLASRPFSPKEPA
jgi:hypothetical protein